MATNNDIKDFPIKIQGENYQQVIHKGRLLIDSSEFSDKSRLPDTEGSGFGADDKVGGEAFA